MLVSLGIALAVYSVYAQPVATKMADFNHDQIISLANASYALYGSNVTTARLIFQGLQANHLDPWLVLAMADHLAETKQPVAAVMLEFPRFCGHPD